VRVYFACSITGGRQDEAVYSALVRALLAAGHEVPTAANAALGVHPEAGHAPVDVYTRDTVWIDASDALIAEVSTPSHGVGYEISYALERAKPVLCLHRAEVAVSKMLSGNTMPGIRLKSYKDTAEAIEASNLFLARLALVR
jgi:nucleoside 2-deoxyribosyltransferase